MEEVVYKLEKETGKLFTNDGESAWRLIGFCKEPTATFENVETKERRSGAISSLIVREFKKLIPEEV